MQLDFTNTSTGEYPVNIATIKSAHPLTMFPTPFNEAFDVWAPVQRTAKPAHDAATHKAVELAPVEEGGEWRQAWEVVARDSQEIDDARRALVPVKVTRRQARRALVLAGLFDLVQPAIDAIADPLERQLAQIDWDDSQEFARNWPLLLQIGQGLGLSDADMDELFIGAAAM
ncbi:MAG: hypothetical protein ACK4OE_15500 [Acidovorax sp.]|uniref:hypothetical protein n=1 Tax=Acidovorax sp. TaxID=1872122 RepID=UPI003918C005